MRPSYSDGSGGGIFIGGGTADSSPISVSNETEDRIREIVDERIEEYTEGITINSVQNFDGSDFKILSVRLKCSCGAVMTTSKLTVKCGECGNEITISE